MGFVYLLRSTGDYVSYYKIGITRSKNIEKRIKQIQTGNHNKVTCVNYFQSKYFTQIEKILHRRFYHLKKEGEWFELDISHESDFKNMCEKIHNNLETINDHSVF